MSTSPSSKHPESFLSPERVALARARRGMNKTDLARALGVTPRTITRYESDGAPSASAETLSAVLDFPEGFFTADEAPEVDPGLVSFRAARKTTARLRNAAVAAGALGIEIDRWISRRFTLPALSLPTHPHEDPRLAARLVRAEWALGTRPLPNAVQLAESRGIRVYTLPLIVEEVDAYSLWHGETPFMFLSRRKTPERMRFDVAHELGHLVLHPATARDGAEQEREADAFASEFLIPHDSIVEYLRMNPTVAEILDARSRLKTSTMATAYAAHKAGRLTDWSYRQACIELTGRGYRTSEPGGMPAHEMSRVFPQVLGKSGAVSAGDIAADLHLPPDDVRSLTFGVELHATGSSADTPPRRTDRTTRRGHLRAV